MTRPIRTNATLLLAALAISLAAGCVNYDPRDYDGDVPDSVTSGASPVPPGSATPAGLGS